MSTAKDRSSGLVDRYLRGSGGVDAERRVKVMRVLWDCIGTEFGGRHELYEINYRGSNDLTRLQNYWESLANGEMGQMKGMVESCMSEYDLDGWTVPDLINNDEVSVLRR